MWSEKKSLVLSKVFTILFMAALAGVLAGGPWLVPLAFIEVHSLALLPDPNITLYFMLTLYSGGLVAGAMLVLLYRLLYFIGLGQVFTVKNVGLLRGISWCCFVGAAICAASTFYYALWGLVGLAAAFVGLIVRVVKNVMAQAVCLKEENDFTV